MPVWSCPWPCATWAADPPRSRSAAPIARPDGLISVDIGSLRLTSRFLKADPPSRRAVQRARDEVREQLGDLESLQVRSALATGGSARALRKLVGSTLDERRLDRAIRLVARQPSDRIARAYGIHVERAQVLLAGALILRETQAVLGVPLHRRSRRPARGAGRHAPRRAVCSLDD